MEKRYGWLVKAFEDIVGLFDTRGKAAITVVLVGCLLYLYVENKELNRARLNDSSKWQDRERDIYMSIIRRYDPEFQRIRDASDSMRVAVDSTRMSIKPVVERLNETLDKIKR